MIAQHPAQHWTLYRVTRMRLMRRGYARGAWSVRDLLSPDVIRAVDAAALRTAHNVEAVDQLARRPPWRVRLARAVVDVTFNAIRGVIPPTVRRISDCRRDALRALAFDVRASLRGGV